MTATLISEIFAFFIILFVLYRYVLPVITKMVAARQETVQQQVDEAEEADRLLAEAEQRHETAVEDARQEAARIRDDARADSTRIREELTQAAQREMERLRQRGAEQLVAQRDQAVRHLRGEIGGQSMDLAEIIVVESLTDDSRRRAATDRVLDEIDGLIRPGRSADARTATAGSQGGSA